MLKNGGFKFSIFQSHNCHSIQKKRGFPLAEASDRHQSKEHSTEINRVGIYRSVADIDKILPLC